MNDDLDKIEEELKRKNLNKKSEHKISGRSVFKIREIIKNKAEKDDQEGKSESAMDDTEK